MENDICGCVLTTRTSAKSDGWKFPIKLCKEESGGSADGKYLKEK